MDVRYHTGKDLLLTGIGAQLRQKRLGLGLAIEDIARETRIASRYLEAIEADDFESLPSLVFTRNFVRQFALFLKLDPEPLLAQLPTRDEAAVKLPDPPARPRSTYHRDRQIRSALTAAAWGEPVPTTVSPSITETVVPTASGSPVTMPLTT